MLILYIAVFVCYIYIFEIAIPSICGTEKELNEVRREIIDLIRSNGAIGVFSAVVSLLVYLFVFHCLTLATFWLIELLAKMYY